MSDLLIRAAGGIITRETDGVIEVLVVHRPHYDDWSLPKGKADGDERDEETALREVEEETGLRCKLDSEVVVSRYVDRKGRPKRVRWYRMTPIEDGGFVPNEEVDEVRWVPIDDVATVLSYDRERAVIEQLD